MRLVIDPHILENAFYFENGDHFELTEEMVLLLHATSYIQELAQKALPPEPCIKIFISYKSENREWAELINWELEKGGYKTWFDKRELRGGDTWMPEIGSKINEATIFLSVMSKWAAKVGGIHKTELDLAREKQRCNETFVIPFKMEDYELPPKLKWLEELHVVSSDSDWFGELRRTINEKIGHQAEIAELVEERDRTCLCIDKNAGYSEIIRRYRSILKHGPPSGMPEKDMPPIEKFEKWKQILESYEALRPTQCFALGPSLKAEMDAYQCRAAEDEVFVKVAIGAEGHLVSEECRQGHAFVACPTVQCLCRSKSDRVLSAREVADQLRDKRNRLMRSTL